MGNIAKSIWSILMSIGQARAASILARQGRFEEAQALYQDQK